MWVICWYSEKKTRPVQIASCNSLHLVLFYKFHLFGLEFTLLNKTKRIREKTEYFAACRLHCCRFAFRERYIRNNIEYSRLTSLFFNLFLFFHISILPSRSLIKKCQGIFIILPRFFLSQ